MPEDPHDAPKEALRVGVVGARRARQGIGFHLARFCAEAGARVVGIVGTRPETIEEARRDLLDVGVRARGHLRVEDLIQEERPDVLVIASPHATHKGCLDLALDAGLHVLCEKPFCWGGDDDAEDARRLARGFLEAGLHLRVNAQWPLTLPTWRALLPGYLERAPSTFRMRLSPRSRGEAMIPDALPHALSLLLAVAPAAAPAAAPAILQPEIRLLAPGGDRMEVTFVYRAGEAEVFATVQLVQHLEQPREAGYGFDGAYASRHVEMQDYRFHLEGGGRRLPLPDPTPTLVRRFLGAVSSSAPPVVDPNAWPGTALLQALHRAWPSDPARTGPSAERTESR